MSTFANTIQKVNTEVKVDTSILNKIERNERTSAKKMLPIAFNSLSILGKEVRVEFIRHTVHQEFAELKYLRDVIKSGLKAYEY